jgi:hypothetical protein
MIDPLDLGTCATDPWERLRGRRWRVTGVIAPRLGGRLATARTLDTSAGGEVQFATPGACGACIAATAVLGLAR